MKWKDAVKWYHSCFKGQNVLDNVVIDVVDIDRVIISHLDVNILLPNERVLSKNKHLIGFYILIKKNSLSEK